MRDDRAVTSAAQDAAVQMGAALVEEAAQRLAGVVERTPLQRNTRLSAPIGGEVWLKREDLQVVRSYKVRGAYNVLAQLTPSERARGRRLRQRRQPRPGPGVRVRQRSASTAASSCRATRRGRSATGSPRSAATRCRSSSPATPTTRPPPPRAADAIRTGATVVPAFDDPRTIAGQGTVALEVVEQLEQSAPRRTCWSCPVGGGGLLAGCVAWLRERHPDVRVVGVEPAGRGLRRRGARRRRPGGPRRPRHVRRRRRRAPRRRR